MTVIVIILILAVLIVPVYVKFEEKARKQVCVGRLKSLYVATVGYLGTNEGKWPRIMPTMSDDVKFAEQWYEVLKNHGIGWHDLVCPSVQRKLNNPDVTKPEFHRMDFVSTFFDDRPGSPTRWPHQPWFLERQDMHVSGQLVILANGTVVDIHEAKRLTSQAAP